ncbi:P-loop containing nucleoside triphosphate hydrolase protein [Pluteus cervinus]|uniref:P-loop containing nucleoside triphosphate hydrolase protein n=1 Tax=Pluteus cervinus TaxID=181527 RepID=A0ACD3AAE9_9AGAR|nr:P-loop containing nucleoside triphosphate hydrolase protein [Pluteus cervinus]
MPCDFQVKSALAQLKQTDTITISPTGSGKTLTFYIPLLFNGDQITIVISPLNILGAKNVIQLRDRYKIRAINLVASNKTDEAYKDIENGAYRVIFVSPETVLTDERFQKLWDSKKFMSRIFNITFDEAHCISQWGDSFRAEYANLGFLRFKLRHIKFHLASATLPKLVLDDVIYKMNLRKNDLTIIQRSVDRPNIHIAVEKMIHSISSMRDLDRVLQLEELDGEPPPKFMVFVNQRRVGEDLCDFKTQELSPLLRDKVSGEIWGLMCTDAAGMGLDIPDIKLVIQWRYVPSLCTLAQRMGRAARGTLEGTAIYLVEPKYFDTVEKEMAASGKRKWDPDDPGGNKLPTSQVCDQLADAGGIESDEEFDEDGGIGEEGDGEIAEDPAEGTSAAVTQASLLHVDIVERPAPQKNLPKLLPSLKTGNGSQYEVDMMTRPPKPRKKRKIKIASYTMDDTDVKLRTCLQNWRKEQMVKEGLGDDQFFGVHLILSNGILDRIVDLVHHSKLLDVKTLSEQTDWRHATFYGPAILELCAPFSRAPPPRRVLPASNVLQPISLNTPKADQGLIQDPAGEGSTISTSKRQCSGCGSDKHISKDQLHSQLTVLNP